MWNNLFFIRDQGKFAAYAVILKSEYCSWIKDFKIVKEMGTSKFFFSLRYIGKYKDVQLQTIMLPSEQMSQ